MKLLYDIILPRCPICNYSGKKVAIHVNEEHFKGSSADISSNRIARHHYLTARDGSICRVFFEEYEVAQFCLNQECLLRQVLAEFD